VGLFNNTSSSLEWLCSVLVDVNIVLPMDEGGIFLCVWYSNAKFSSPLALSNHTRKRDASASNKHNDR